MIKKLIIGGILVTLSLGSVGIAMAAPNWLFQNNSILPAQNNTFDLGTTTGTVNSGVWRNLYVTQICLSADCKTAWPVGGAGSVGNWFTPTSWGNSTSTILGFPGFISTASSTLSYLGSGIVGANNGRLYAVASSTLFGATTPGFVWSYQNGAAGWYATSSAVSGVTSVTATAPIFSSGGATPNITWAGLATTSQPASSNLLVSNGGAGVFGVATGTITCTGNASCSTTGLSVIGGNLTINATGGTGTGLGTTTPIAGSNLLVYSAAGAGAAYGVATSTTGTARSILALNSAGGTTIPFASTTAISIGSWAVATSTTVCISPEQCQFPATASAAETAIQAAVDYVASAGGGTVHIKAGQYTLTSDVTIFRTKNVTIEGEGDGTVIYTPHTGVSNRNNGFYISTSTDVMITKIGFNGTNQQAAAFNNDMAIHVNNSNNIRIIDNSFTNMNGFGIYARSQEDPGTNFASSTAVTISRNTMECNAYQDCIGGGADQSSFGISTTTQYIITNNIITQTTFAGGVENSTMDTNCVDIVAVQNLQMTGNICLGNLVFGSEQNANQYSMISNNILDAPLGPVTVSGDIVVITNGTGFGVLPSNLSIVGNILRNGKILVAGSGTNINQNILISGNNITTATSTAQNYNSVGYQGIYLDTVNNAQVSGNLIDAKQSISTSKGIYATNSSNVTVMSNNVRNFAGTGAIGIDLQSGTNNRSILNNFLNNTTNEANIPNSMTFDTNGRLGVGSTSPWKLLSIGNSNTGTFAISTSTAGCLSIAATGEVFSTGSACGTGGGVSSVTATWPIVSSGGATPNITWTGLATTSQPAISNLLASNGAAGVYGAATTTASCSGNTSCTAFTILGSTPITISSSGGSGGGTWSTTTSQVSGTFINYPNNNTDVVTVGGNATTTAPFYIDPNPTTSPQLSIGSTSPFAQLSVHLMAANTYIPTAFAIGSSTPTATSTLFSVLATGNVGIGNTAPSSLLTVGSGNTGTFNISTSTAGCLSISSSGLVYSTGTACGAGGGVSSVTATAPIFSSGGATPNITWAGLATTSQPASSNLLVSNGGAGVFGVGTTSATCGTGVTCTGFNVLGTANPSFALAALGSAGVLGAVTATTPTVQATSTLYGASTGGMVLGWDNATGGIGWVATSTGAGGGGIGDPFTHPSLGLSATTTQMLVGTSTASNYQLTIASSTAPQLSLSAGAGLSQWAFRNAGGNLYLSTTTIDGIATTTIPALTITGSNGFVGIGTSTPYAQLSLNALGGIASYFAVGSSTEVFNIRPTSNSYPQYGLGTTSPWGMLSINPVNIGTAPAFVIGSTTATKFIIDNNGKVAVGTTTLSGMLNIGTNTGVNTASTTIRTGKIQWDVYNTAGARRCVFIVGTTVTVSSTACTD